MVVDVSNLYHTISARGQVGRALTYTGFYKFRSYVMVKFLNWIIQIWQHSMLATLNLLKKSLKKLGNYLKNLESARKILEIAGNCLKSLENCWDSTGTYLKSTQKLPFLQKRCLNFKLWGFCQWQYGNSAKGFRNENIFKTKCTLYMK